MSDASPAPRVLDHLSEAFRAWLSPVFAEPAMAERRATCHECAMCAPRDPKRAISAEGLLNPNVKCCSYHPVLPSFTVGALLSDTRPELDEGRRRMRVRIAEQHGVTPHGVEGSPSYWLRYNSSATAFGQAESLLCPFFDKGRCTIWQFREAVCSTYFCKHDRGQEGLTFWRAVRDYLVEATNSLVVHVMLELGFDPADALTRPRRDVSPEDLDGRPLKAAEYRARWGAYAGREEQFFREAHALVAKLSPEDVARIGGSQLRGRLAVVERCRRAMMEPQIPARLRRNPELRVLADQQGGYLVQGYFPMDASRVSATVYGLLDAFDGRTTDEVREDLLQRGEARPSAGLVQALYHHRVLVDATPSPSSASGSCSNSDSTANPQRDSR